MSRIVLVMFAFLCQVHTHAQTFRKMYIGNVGPHSVTMTLIAKEGNVSGTYYYDNSKEPISIHGFIAGRSIEISGFDILGNKIDRFIGQISRFDIHGIWIGEELKNRYAFSLKEEIVFTPEIKPTKWELYLIIVLVAITSLALVAKSRQRDKKQTWSGKFKGLLTGKVIYFNTSKKEYEFEKHITNLLNPEIYKLLKWNSEKASSKTSNRKENPNLEFEKKNTNHFKNIFSIKCRYSGKQVEEVFHLGTNQNLAEYKSYSKNSNKPLFFAIGMGGKPSNPEQLYVIPVEKIENETISLSDISEFKIAGQKLNYDPLSETLK